LQKNSGDKFYQQGRKAGKVAAKAISFRNEMISQQQQQQKKRSHTHTFEGFNTEEFNVSPSAFKNEQFQAPFDTLPITSGTNYQPSVVSSSKQQQQQNKQPSNDDKKSDDTDNVFDKDNNNPFEGGGVILF